MSGMTDSMNFVWILRSEHGALDVQGYKDDYQAVSALVWSCLRQHGAAGKRRLLEMVESHDALMRQPEEASTLEEDDET